VHPAYAEVLLATKRVRAPVRGLEANAKAGRSIFSRSSAAHQSGVRVARRMLRPVRRDRPRQDPRCSSKQRAPRGRSIETAGRLFCRRSPSRKADREGRAPLRATNIRAIRDASDAAAWASTSCNYGPARKDPTRPRLAPSASMRRAPSRAMSGRATADAHGDVLEIRHGAAGARPRRRPRERPDRDGQLSARIPSASARSLRCRRGGSLTIRQTPATGASRSATPRRPLGTGCWRHGHGMADKPLRPRGEFDDKAFELPPLNAQHPARRRAGQTHRARGGDGPFAALISMSATSMHDVKRQTSEAQGPKRRRELLEAEPERASPSCGADADYEDRRIEARDPRCHRSCAGRFLSRRRRHGSRLSAKGACSASSGSRSSLAWA